MHPDIIVTYEQWQQHKNALDVIWLNHFHDKMKSQGENRHYLLSQSGRGVMLPQLCSSSPSSSSSSPHTSVLLSEPGVSVSLSLSDIKPCNRPSSGTLRLLGVTRKPNKATQRPECSPWSRTGLTYRVRAVGRNDFWVSKVVSLQQCTGWFWTIVSDWNQQFSNFYGRKCRVFLNLLLTASFLWRAVWRLSAVCLCGVKKCSCWSGEKLILESMMALQGLCVICSTKLKVAFCKFFPS